MVIGLLGAIGSGKSAVARLFAEAGATVVDADRFAREEMERPEARERIARIFGNDVLRPDGTVDRKALAARAFADAASLRELNEAVHPPVRQRIREEIRRHRGLAAARGPEGVLVLDVPLLAESPRRAECDALVFVDAPERVRAERVRERGWPDGEAKRREGFQTPLEEKREMARWTVDNSGPMERTRGEVSRVLRAIAEQER